MDGRMMDNHILVPIDGGLGDNSRSGNEEQFFDIKMKKRKQRSSDSKTKDLTGENHGNNIDDLISSLAALQDTFGSLQKHFTTNYDNVTSQENSYLIQEPPAEKVEVFVNVVFLKLGEIDTLKETFSADVMITAKWRERRMKTVSSGTPVEGSLFWDPELYVENLFGEAKETIWCMAEDDNGKMMMCQKRRLKATFIETIELGRFPFDTQDLHITIKSTHPETLVTLRRDESSESSINLESFVDQQEWHLQSNIETVELTGSPQLKAPRARCSGISVSCKARRRPGFFIWNILLVMIFICSLAFTTFSVSVDKPQNRLQLTFTLVLTMVTFKFIVNNSLPKISYLTYLDKYVLVSMGVLITVGVWHAVIAAVLETEDLETVKTVDKAALIIIGLFYLAHNVLFAVLVYVKTRQNKNKEKNELE